MRMTKYRFYYKAIVIKDIEPRAPVHLLAIPKKQISSLAEMEDEDAHVSF